jgi:putative transposase
MRSTPRPGRGSGNSRNGSTGKTLLTEVGAVELALPRDRVGSFDPKIVRKGQTRLEGFNDRIIALYAGHDHPRHPGAPAGDV